VAAYQNSFGCGGAKFHQENYEGYVDTVPYGCWRKSTLEQIGMFDETLVRNQDDDLNLRLVRSGGKIFQSTQIVSWYRPRSSLKTLFRQYFQYGYWKVAVIRKHGLPASWRHLVPGTFVLGLGGLATGSVLSWMADLWWLFSFFTAAGLLVGGLYVLIALTAALLSTRVHGWSILPILPLVFLVYHFSYGFGFALGLLHYRNDPERVRTRQFVSGVTR
jgi:hypothetical protein